MEQKDKITAAKRLINDTGIMALLNEYMLSVEETLNPQAIAQMSDERIGQITRADITADDKIRNRFAKIKNLAQMAGESKPVVKK